MQNEDNNQQVHDLISGYLKGELTPDDSRYLDWDIYSSNFQMTWKRLYIAVRSCNLFFENLDKIPDDGVSINGLTEKTMMTGEVHFLRAYFYQDLMRLYGGVPIITKAYKLTDDFLAPRDSYEDCVQFIIDECDLAASMLPLAHSGNDKGRITKGAALSLKSRVLIYAASDLYNTTVFPSFSNPELIGYIDKSSEARATRYQAAKDAAKAVIDLGIYSLFRPTPDPSDSVAQNFTDLFLSYDTPEDIYIRYFTTTSFTISTNWQNLCGPNGYHCRGSCAPIGELVDDYEMKDGTKFDWNNPTHSYQPYKNRDPRFYATIFYEGAKWRKRAPREYPLDTIGVIQVGVWQRWNESTNSIYEVWGLDTRKGPNSPFEGSYTAYYTRKYMDINVDGQFEIQDTPWRYIRFAEILLNYAEACIGLGQDAEARTYINMIRERAGMPEITESGIALRDRFRNEKRIEMAFEDQRFWDVRRWVIGPEAYVSESYAEVVYPLLPDKTTATIPTITPKVLNPRAWLDKSYFFPILRPEMNRNPLLVQNPGYN